MGGEKGEGVRQICWEVVSRGVMVVRACAPPLPAASPPGGGRKREGLRHLPPLGGEKGREGGYRERLASATLLNSMRDAVSTANGAQVALPVAVPGGSVGRCGG